jgi:hypothetical protein
MDNLSSNELKIIFKSLELTYIFKKRKYDNNSMIVVFSGFGAAGNFTYDFKNALNEIHSSVLWIKDDFYGNAAYYYAVNGRDIHPIINDFILDVAHKNNVKKDNIILSGFSKGGSAALFYGFKYDYHKIVATVPQIEIGTYCKQSHQDVLFHILGKMYTQRQFDDLNAAISMVLKQSNYNKNIYFLTSKADEQYKSQIEPFLDRFYRFSNFNLFYSESVLVRTHNQVTAHHVQLVLSWFYSLISDLAPVYGTKRIKGDNLVTSEVVELKQYVIELRSLKLINEKIYPEGVGLVRNYNFRNWSDVDYSLLIENNESKYELSMAKAHRPALTRDFYNGIFSIYDKCFFTTYKYDGIDISHIKSGRYDLKLKIHLKNINEYVIDHIASKKNLNIENERYRCYQNSQGYCELLVK